MTSAWSITAAVNPPRAAFVDFPLGHTTGKAGDLGMQRDIVRRALTALEELDEPGHIVDLGLTWGEEGWRADPLRSGPPSSGDAETSGTGGDSRTARHDTPQYQSEEDRALAEARVGAEAACQACVGFDA